MKILAIGDVCGKCGCDALLNRLPTLKKELGVSFTVINGENSSEAGCISRESAQLLLNAGADVITGGNHTLHRRDFRSLLDDNPRLLRPHNLPNAQYGSGYCTVDMGFTTVAVINLLGSMYLDTYNAQNPFTVADELIARAKSEGIKVIIVDFHAEATAEKRALGMYLDGRVSAVFGTHTHVQTGDACILSGGTAYITDLGMTGAANSILGVQSEIIINRFKNGDGGRFIQADGAATIEGMLFDVDLNSGKSVFAQAIRIT